MSGTYGDLLTFFPELIRRYPTFTAKPLTGGGYGARENEGIIRGIIMAMKGGDLPVETGLLAETNVLTLWTRAELGKDSFVEYEKEPYRRTKSNDWFTFGRTHIYILESVVGTFNTQTKSTGVKFGKELYG